MYPYFAGHTKLLYVHMPSKTKGITVLLSVILVPVVDALKRQQLMSFSVMLS